MNDQESLPATTYLKNYQPPNFYIHKTKLHIEISKESVKVSSVLTISRNTATDKMDKSLSLSGKELSLQSVSVNGGKLTSDEYVLSDGNLVITSVPDQFLLETEVLIYPKNNTSLEGLYKSRTMYCTQCEAEGFRRITYYLDRPDVMSEFTTTIVADKSTCPILLSNGNLIDSGEVLTDLNEVRHWATWHDPFPKPSYLFAIVAGDLSVVQDGFLTVSGKQIDIQLFVEPKDIDKCSHALESLKHAMKWDEEVFGREYDLSLYMIVAVDDFNMGAMENKGLNIFNTSCVLAHPKTTTDQGFKRVEAVVAHEYFHNWSGNRVTCRDWFQLSLKEGFTVFRDSEFSAYMGSPTVKRIEDVNFLRSIQFAEDSGPTAHPVQPQSYMEISNFYTVTIYEKGAEIVRMIYTLLGPKLFRKGSDLYFSRYDGQAVTIDDFVSIMSEVSGRSFKQFMIWYERSGTPLLTVTSYYDKKNCQYKLTFKQSFKKIKNKSISIHEGPYHIPIKLGLISDQGPISISKNGEKSILIELKEEEETFTFNNVGEYPVPSILQGFSAPVKLDYNYSEKDLAVLVSKDEDGFNRWNASQELAIHLMKNMQIEFRSSGKFSSNPYLNNAFLNVISMPDKDMAMQALILTLPSESIMSELSNEVDVEAIHAVRNFISSDLGRNLNEHWENIYSSNITSMAYSFNANEVARRSLKNLALRYMVSGKSHNSLKLLKVQATESDNMTDTLSALAALVNDDRLNSIDLASELLSKFYLNWKDEPLVLNQWFQLQASCQLPGGLDRVRLLMDHPAFDFNNPNKVRSLIGVFCSNNPTNFHCDKGDGYNFLADQILALDKLNPQIASRLLNPLTRWRKFPQHRGNLMRAELVRVASENGLSRDTYEIASKGLK